MIRCLTSGESHGRQLDIIIDGFPSNFKLDINRINQDLAKRQIKIGSGKRMSIESDKVTVNAGIMNQKTTGAPLSFSIKNLDHCKWKGKKIDSFVIPRPGHADFSGVNKYGLDDIRPILERASARETATRVVLGSCCMQVLEQLGIKIESFVSSVNGANRGKDPNAYKCDIDNALKLGETLGGCIESIVSNVPIGLGSCMQYDRKLDAKIAFAIMSIPAIKGIEFGRGFKLARMFGSQAQKHLGGITGGISNGDDIEIRCVMKPIPTTLRQQESVDLSSGKKCKTKYERSDIVPIFRTPIIVSSMIAYTILNEIIDVFGGDDWQQLKKILCNNKTLYTTNKNKINRKKKEFWKNGK